MIQILNQENWGQSLLHVILEGNKSIEKEKGVCMDPIQDFQMKIPENCNNAPKKRVLKDYIIAFAKKDTEFINEYTSKDIVWNIVNDTTVQGRENVIRTVENKLTKRIIEIELITIITHGHTAAVNGTIKLEDDRIISFCNLYRFVSAGKNTIKEITSYVINNG